jgi:hypothetical protein
MAAAGCVDGSGKHVVRRTRDEAKDACPSQVELVEKDGVRVLDHTRARSRSRAGALPFFASPSRKKKVSFITSTSTYCKVATDLAWRANGCCALALVTNDGLSTPSQLAPRPGPDGLAEDHEEHDELGGLDHRQSSPERGRLAALASDLRVGMGALARTARHHPARQMATKNVQLGGDLATSGVVLPTVRSCCRHRLPPRGRRQLPWGPAARSSSDPSREGKAAAQTVRALVHVAPTTRTGEAAVVKEDPSKDGADRHDAEDVDGRELECCGADEPGRDPDGPSNPMATAMLYPGGYVRIWGHMAVRRVHSLSLCYESRRSRSRPRSEFPLANARSTRLPVGPQRRSG